MHSSLGHGCTEVPGDEKYSLIMGEGTQKDNQDGRSQRLDKDDRAAKTGLAQWIEHRLGN